MRKYLLLFIVFFTIQAFAQHRASVKIIGYVKNADGKALADATVYIKNTAYSTSTDKDGHYILVVVPGKYEIIGSKVGFLAHKEFATVNTGENKYIQFDLNADPSTTLDQVVVAGKSSIQEVRESPFNVVALDAKAQYNTNLDLAHLLDKAPGVKLRESGGVGSDANISINGFTGRYIKVFMDGVPMQGFGSAFQLNNIPVSLAERVEIYKGVIPIEFGADAIGGVINIVTNRSTNSFLDASYSYGSFNTHRTNISLGHTTDRGFSFQLNAYQNYSDNSYKIKSQLMEANGFYSQEQYWFKRFHDTYHNEAIVAKLGWVNKSWADRFFIGMTLSQQSTDIQNSATDIKFVYGARKNTGSGIFPSLEYYKRDLFLKGLTVRLMGNYNFNNNHNIDTARYQYDWNGDKTELPSRGEGGVNSLTDYRNTNYSTTANISYSISPIHSISINDVLSGSSRKNTENKDSAAEIESNIDSIKRSNFKNVLGVSYRYRPNKNININAFGKNYWQHVTGPYMTSSLGQTRVTYEERDASYNTTGYGLAGTYFLTDYQFKGSVEKTYRLPSDNELFGDEIQESGNGSLLAENSMNYNLGLTLNKPFKDNVFYVDISTYYRHTKDFIRRISLPLTGGALNINHGLVITKGVDLEARYYFKNRAMIGGNVTYQDVRDRAVDRTGSDGKVLSGSYGARIPNVPYFYGNADAAYYFHNLGGNGNVLTLNYTLNFVGEFYLLWEGNGDPSKKLTLPKQLSHDFTATYSMRNGRYNFTLEAKNLTNEELFDNFSMMKPGRAFYGKFRYYLMKRKQN